MSKGRRWLGRNAIRIYAVVAFAYLFVPVAYTLVYSFNDSGKSNIAWRGFTLDKWKNPCGAPDVCPALGNSLKIGLLATLIATVLGTMIAFALARHRFRGRTATNLTIFLPMATPEVVMGSSLLAMFVALGFSGVLGFVTIVIAHVLFCLSFVVVTVKARLTGMDSRLEQAAMDLYANEWQTFRLVTLPLAMPGVVAAALLSFSLSFDDFIVTNFTAGQDVTFPLYVYGSKLKDFPAQNFVIGSLMFFISFILVIGAEIWRRTRPQYR